jgi:hypothetical protein
MRKWIGLVEDFCLLEFRQGLLRHLTGKCPGVPEYILRDLVARGVKGSDNPADMQELIQMVNRYTWKNMVLTITLDSFVPEDQQLLKTRMNTLGTDWNSVPHDIARHNTQQDLLANGPSGEPIICVKSQDSLELWEGWHRTIQSLIKWPKGYQQNAWVGYEKKYGGHWV